MKHLATKLLLCSTIVLTALVVVLLPRASAPPAIQAQTTGEPDVQCIARDLAIYMNALTTRAGNLSHIKLLSPAFNLTSSVEWQIFDLMTTQPGERGDFSRLDGFAGNSYSHVPGGGFSFTSYDWYSRADIPDGRGVSWKTRFTGGPTFFTEYGDFNYDANPGSISLAASQHQITANDPKVSSINYFNALGGNQEFTRHQLDKAEFDTITSTNPGKAGVNSAMEVTPGTFVNTAVGYSGNVNWILEIAYSRGAVQTVADFANRAHELGKKPILRVCAGNTCDFANPVEYANFLADVNSKISGDLWVIAGPNEPATELWATPACITTTPYEIENWDCNTVTDPEYHSLRPYPANPCNKTASGVNQCGNDFTVIETLEVNQGQAVPGSCTGDAGETQTCRFIVDSNLNAEIDLSRAQLPIMGNTQLVPNATGPNATLTYKDRMAGYASWYLNGVVQRAEERFFSFPSDQDLLLSMSGPIKKLLPQRVQSGDRYIAGWYFGFIPYYENKFDGLRFQQGYNVGTQRHDQIVECGSVDSPEACYSQSNTYNRLTGVLANTFLKTMGATTFSSPEALGYVPYSSTEDRIGMASFSPIGLPSGEGVTITDFTVTQEGSDSPTGSASRNLYFAHMEETKELAEVTQRTFIPGEYTGALDSPKTDDITLPQRMPGCEFQDTRSNAGDDLYGELEREGVAGENPLQATLSYTADFTCDFTPSVDQNLYNACWLIGYCESPAACGIGGTWNPDPSCTPGLGRCVLPLPPAGVFDNVGCREAAMTYPTTCQKTITIPLAMSANTPEADSVWQRLVAGSWSVFRRIFPRISADAPLSTIKDIPAETTSGYLANSISVENGSSASVSALSGNNRPGSAAEFYFPHIGSVQDYFLEGIQCALRPLGLCGNETFSEDELPDEPAPPIASEANCRTDIPDTALPAQYLGSFKDNAIRICEQWDSRGVSNGRRCYNDVVSRAVALGVHPTFALAIWAHESACSNYTASPLLWQDFGINNAAYPPENFNAQYTRFLQIWNSQTPYQSTYPNCFTTLRARGWSDMEIAMEIFFRGGSSCTSFASPTYFDAIASTAWDYFSACPMPVSPKSLTCQP